ncbi:MAG: endoglucanase [Alphaproteobacteria bacterium]|nr:MAG: endoglucanase [Alphaproteobacteria bacterium]
MNRREIIVGATALAACGPAESQATAAPFPMRRGVNLGNALEAPNEGDWGYRIELPHLDAIRDAGFDGIRLPVRFDAHAGATPPYAFGGDFWRRIDEIVEYALGLELMVQLDMHHYEGLISEPERQRDRFLGMWAVIAQHYRGAPAGLFYEPFNEPNGRHWGASALMALQRELIGVIRERDARRLIVLGPGNWQNIDALRTWRPPEGENIAVSVHYYEPHAFTHQRAEWLEDAAPVFERDWGTSDDRAQVSDHVAQAARWSEQRGFAMQLGEFGVNNAVGVQQRAAWTRAVRQACEANGMGWCVWDFAGAFPIWDRDASAFIPLMRDALFA